MKKIIWMELALIGASILIFRSAWNLLDKNAWASSEAGLTVLLVVGIAAAVVSLRGIEVLAGKTGENGKKESSVTAKRDDRA